VPSELPPESALPAVDTRVPAPPIEPEQQVGKSGKTETPPPMGDVR